MWISPCSLSFSQSKYQVNGLERYDAMHAAYSSLDSRSISCHALEMLGRALVAQTFVTPSLGAVFSPEFAIVLYRDRSPGSFSDVTSGLTATGREKVGGGRSRFLMAFFTRKTGAKILEKIQGATCIGQNPNLIFKK